MTIDIKDIISYAVHCRRDSYYKLKNYERTDLVAWLLEKAEQALIDADQDLTLQKAIAKVILREGNEESMQELYKEIMRLYVIGDKNLEAHFVEKIDELLHEEWMEQNAGPNEHFENDAMNRSIDAQLAANPPRPY